MVVNLGGMAIAVGCLALAHYVLELTSGLADNMSANGVGLVLGTAFRYVCYSRLVFPGAPQALADAEASAPKAEAAVIV